MCSFVTLSLIVLMGTVGTAEEAIPQQDTRTLVEDLLGDDSVRSVEALVLLLSDDTLIDYVVEILERIDNKLMTLDLTPLHKMHRLPRWAVLLSPILGPNPQANRKEAILKALCVYIRETVPSKKRDVIRRVVLEYLKQEYMRHRSSSLLCLVHDLFFWGNWIEPESDCQEIIQFMEFVLMEYYSKEKLLSDREIAELSNIAFSYIIKKSDISNSEQLITRYEKYFDPDVGIRLRELLREPIPRITEAYYKELLTKSPAELFKMISDNCEMAYYRKDGWLITKLLAGTCELRRENFSLLLPCIKESQAGPMSTNFLTIYCVPPAIDSTPEEKKQTDIVFDILVEQIRKDPVGTNTNLLGWFITDSAWCECDVELDYTYMLKRVKAIAEEDGLLPDAVSKELLDEISRQFPE